MNLREVQRLELLVEATPGMEPRGWRFWTRQERGRAPKRIYALECVDTRSGCPFVLRSREEYDAKFAEQHREE